MESKQVPVFVKTLSEDDPPPLELCGHGPMSRNPPPIPRITLWNRSGALPALDRSEDDGGAPPSGHES